MFAAPSRRLRPRARRAALLTGLIWAVVQFAICEGLYRWSIHANLEEPDLIGDASDVVAWPAGEIWDLVDLAKMREALTALDKVDPPLTEEERALRDELYTRIKDIDDSEAWDQAYEMTEARGFDPYIDSVTEYLIYGGTCVAWGCLVALVSRPLYHRRLRRKYMPPPVPSA